MIWLQTKAIFYDAYRALRARKMFWVVLGLSVLVVVLLAMLSIDAAGMSFMGKHISPFPSTRPQ